MNNFDEVNKRLIKSDKIVSDKIEYTMNTYDIEGYGPCEWVSKKESSGGEYRKSRTNIPEQYRNVRAKDFDWNAYGCDVSMQKDTCNDFIMNFNKLESIGDGLYIYSKTKGSGKTMLSCIFINEILRIHPINAKFITALDLINLTKKGFRYESCNDEVDSFMNARLLVLDDLGVQMKKEWSDTVLYRLVNHRINKKLMTIYTSNVSTDELEIDTRISDRIFTHTIPLILPEIPIRNIKAKERNTEYFKNLNKKAI